MIKQFLGLAAVSLVAAGAASSASAVNLTDDDTIVVTASNTAANALLVYSSGGVLLQSIATQGAGGVGGNAGGIAASEGRIAVVNYGSGTVSVFTPDAGPAVLRLSRVIPTLGKPVSVAFGHDHLYILTGAQIESHRIQADGVSYAPDGSASLLHADGSAGQVGVLSNELIVSEKSNAVETFHLDAHGAVGGAPMLVGNLPANINVPLGLATRDDVAYVTIAHADEISLVRNDAVRVLTPSVSQHAPCWVALDGPYLFSANTPSKSVSRYAVTGHSLVQEVPVAASFAGGPTDIAYGRGLVAVVDSTGTVAHLTVFNVDGDGNLATRASAQLGSATPNGVAVVHRGDLW